MSSPQKLGIESDEPGNYPTKFNKREQRLADAIHNNQNITETFEQALCTSGSDQVDGTAYTGATGEVLGIHSGKNGFECYQAAVAVAAVITPYRSADGLELQPVAAADALELTNGTTSGSKAAHTCRTDEGFFCEVTAKIDDISDVTLMFFGFRKAEAYQANPDNYDEMAGFSIGNTDDGRISLATILNNAATALTDTTLADWADGETHTLRVEVNKQGYVTFKYDNAAPTVTATFRFDSGEVVIPYLHLNSETGDPGCSISSWKCGKI